MEGASSGGVEMTRIARKRSRARSDGVSTLDPSKGTLFAAVGISEARARAIREVVARATRAHDRPIDAISYLLDELCWPGGSAGYLEAGIGLYLLGMRFYQSDEGSADGLCPTGWSIWEHVQRVLVKGDAEVGQRKYAEYVKHLRGCGWCAGAVIGDVHKRHQCQ